MVGPKKVLDVGPDRDGSASIHAMVRRGVLIPLKDDPIPQGEKVEEEEAPLGEEEELPSMEWTKKQLVARAESMGLELPSSATKAEILKAIED